MAIACQWPSRHLTSRAARTYNGGVMATSRSMKRSLLPLDVIAAARSLRRTPGFTTAAVISLALSIGAGVVGFGVIDAVRFRALPFPHAERLVLISETPKS